MKKNLILLSILSLSLLPLVPGCVTSPSTVQTTAEAPAQTLAALPEAVTSFGAVTTDGWLYAYGGHKGERHNYSAEMVSGSFHRLRLSEGRTWEKLASSAPAQGLPLVAQHGLVYRIGGMAARNTEGAKQDLYSMDLVQRFDPAKKSWETLPSLPKPRSSHDAVVIGNKIYVAGGWQLIGTTNKAVWPANGLVLDLSNPKSGWKEFSQPFQRRALATASLGSLLFCVGGMDSDNQTTLAVDVYNVESGQWTKGPELPPGKHKGFGCSAIAQDGRIYVNTFQGDLLRLSSDHKTWEVVGRLEHPRIAHRLVTAGTRQLIAFGGEDGEEKRPDLELLTPSLQTAAAKTASLKAHQE